MRLTWALKCRRRMGMHSKTLRLHKVNSDRHAEALHAEHASTRWRCENGLAMASRAPGAPQNTHVSRSLRMRISVRERANNSDAPPGGSGSGDTGAVLAENTAGTSSPVCFASQSVHKFKKASR